MKWSKSINQPKHVSQYKAEDLQIRHELSQEKALQTKMAQIRRKRLEQEHKMILIQELSEK